MKMGVPLGNRPAVPRDWFRGVPERYVAEAETRGRPEGRPYPGSQQAIHQTSGLDWDGFKEPPLGGGSVKRCFILPAS